MGKFLTGASGQIFALVIISFGTGMTALLAFDKLLRGDSFAWYLGGLTVLMCFVICVNSLRLRKLMP